MLLLFCFPFTIFFIIMGLRVVIVNFPPSTEAATNKPSSNSRYTHHSFRTLAVAIVVSCHAYYISLHLYALNAPSDADTRRWEEKQTIYEIAKWSFSDFSAAFAPFYICTTNNCSIVRILRGQRTR